MSIISPLISKDINIVVFFVFFLILHCLLPSSPFLSIWVGHGLLTFLRRIFFQMSGHPESLSMFKSEGH